MPESFSGLTRFVFWWATIVTFWPLLIWWGVFGCDERSGRRFLADVFDRACEEWRILHGNPIQLPDDARAAFDYAANLIHADS